MSGELGIARRLASQLWGDGTATSLSYLPILESKGIWEFFLDFNNTGIVIDINNFSHLTDVFDRFQRFVTVNEYTDMGIASEQHFCAFDRYDNAVVNLVLFNELKPYYLETKVGDVNDEEYLSQLYTGYLNEVKSWNEEWLEEFPQYNVSYEDFTMQYEHNEDYAMA